MSEVLPFIGSVFGPYRYLDPTESKHNGDKYVLERFSDYSTSSVDSILGANKKVGFEFTFLPEGSGGKVSIFNSNRVSYNTSPHLDYQSNFSVLVRRDSWVDSRRFFPYKLEDFKEGKNGSFDNEITRTLCVLVASNIIYWRGEHYPIIRNDGVFVKVPNTEKFLGFFPKHEGKNKEKATYLYGALFLATKEAIIQMPRIAKSNISVILEKNLYSKNDLKSLGLLDN